MKKTVTFNKGGNGYTSGRIIIPKTYLDLIGVTEENREVEITYKDGKIIIEKK